MNLAEMTMLEENLMLANRNLHEWLVKVVVVAVMRCVDLEQQTNFELLLLLHLITNLGNAHPNMPDNIHIFTGATALQHTSLNVR